MKFQFMTQQVDQGSLLINIGKSIEKYRKDKNSIKYYAQELKEATYNLTRMNLIMRNIQPSNIMVRNAIH